MKTIYILLVLLSGLFIIMAGCNNQSAKAKKAATVTAHLPPKLATPDSERNDSIAFAQIEKLREYERMQKSFDKTNKDTAYHFRILLHQEPEKGFKYYWMTVGEDGPYMFHTWEHFYVNAHDWSVYHYDTTSDSTLTIDQWRKSGKDGWMK